MAISLLFILFTILAVVSFISIILLYNIKSEKLQNFVFYFLSAWSLSITFINFTSLPSNYIVSKIFASLFGIVALVSLFIKVKYPQKKKISNLLLCASVILGLLDLFF